MSDMVCHFHMPSDVVDPNTFRYYKGVIVLSDYCSRSLHKNSNSLRTDIFIFLCFNFGHSTVVITEGGGLCHSSSFFRLLVCHDSIRIFF